MEKKERLNLLYDFYGELLNENQRTVFEDYIENDLSLSEIAEERGISRQGVHDMVKRLEKTLEGHEEKLHLLRRFQDIKEDVASLKGKTKDPEILKSLDDIIDKL